jgi:hypothetical protein
MNIHGLVVIMATVLLTVIPVEATVELTVQAEQPGIHISPTLYGVFFEEINHAGDGNLISALGEAAFMTGLERNADVVKMSSYAPLFVNANNSRWTPDAIVFDSSRVYGTPSYHVQQMFAEHLGDAYLQPCLRMIFPY